MRIGFGRAGWHVAFANDIDEDKWRMYRDHFGDEGEFVLGDVHELPAARVPAVDLATASFPCNDLSLADARKGLKGEQSSAFWGFIGVFEEMGHGEAFGVRCEAPLWIGRGDGIRVPWKFRAC
jgi:DNA (cytosine-5)-methyltransferase 1